MPFELKKNADESCCVFHMISFTGKRNLPAKSGKDKSINARQGKFEIHRCVKQLTKSEKLAGLQKASNFKSNWPFFKVLMQPCYVHRSQMVSFLMETCCTNLVPSKFKLHIRDKCLSKNRVE